ncbi:hypothetical protein ACFWQG_16475 [Rhodococcus sp. NPDC058532]|uniref:hypothetical protein n=1 Tax=Rhodococcus sp. NPDC058532 TaxID=3346540 RepID=UPI00364BA51E
MTRATAHTAAPHDAETDATSPDATAPSASDTALRLAKSSALGVLRGASGLAKGGASVGTYLFGNGYTLAKTAASRAKRRAAAPHTEDLVVVAATDKHRGRLLRRVLVFGAVGAAAAAAVAAWRLRRPEPAPVADQPPSLRDVEVVE